MRGCDPFFFFSSRRRHTRCGRDWSSDVCSSDLASPAARCRHNLGYWTGADWWGIGPGAHSHVGGVRWWNVRHPREYAARITTGASPGAARELLSGDERALEDVMLRLRLADGLPLPALSERGRQAA